jgi:hypothetical protein
MKLNHKIQQSINVVTSILLKEMQQYNILYYIMQPALFGVNYKFIASQSTHCQKRSFGCQLWNFQVLVDPDKRLKHLQKQNHMHDPEKPSNVVQATGK